MPSSSLTRRSTPTSTLFPYTTLFRSVVSSKTVTAAVPRPRQPTLPGPLKSSGVSNSASVIRPMLIPPGMQPFALRPFQTPPPCLKGRDRKSTRLNSSHTVISYAVFFFNTTLNPDIYTLSLHDALPICRFIEDSDCRRAKAKAADLAGTIEVERRVKFRFGHQAHADTARNAAFRLTAFPDAAAVLERPRSEEHTSELQSHSDLVCRLLL